MTPQDPSDDPSSEARANRRRGIIIALVAVGLSLFMYVSFIIKTAIKGP